MPSLPQPDPPRTLEEAIGIIDELRAAHQQLQDKYDDLQSQVQQLLDQISKSSRNCVPQQRSTASRSQP